MENRAHASSCQTHDKHNISVRILMDFCPLWLLCGRRLKSDVRPWVRESVRRFCDICLYNLNMGHQNWVLLLTEETKIVHFGTLKFELFASQAVRLFFSFVTKLKKVHRWYLTVKCEKLNKWTRFLSVKTLKNALFYRWEHSIYVRLTSPNNTFRLFHTRAPRATLALRV